MRELIREELSNAGVWLIRLNVNWVLYPDAEEGRIDSGRPAIPTPTYPLDSSSLSMIRYPG
ncbi:MAG: hypothetical protein R3E93_08745 [Thiothrix sp.]